MIVGGAALSEQIFVPVTARSRGADPADSSRFGRLDLKPGITGMWQVLGRDGIPFNEMIRFDYEYVTTWSVSRDMCLLLRTIPRTVRSA